MTRRRSTGRYDEEPEARPRRRRDGTTSYTLTVIKFVLLCLALLPSFLLGPYSASSSAIFMAAGQSRGGGGISGGSDTLQMMMMPTDEIDDEETFTYKQNFLQNELNKQNFIYTIDKYRAVFSSVHIIALKVLSHHHHPPATTTRLHRDDETSGGRQKKPKTPSRVTSNNIDRSSPTTLPAAAAAPLPGTVAGLVRGRQLKEPRANWTVASSSSSLAADTTTTTTTTTVSDGFRIEGKFRFLNKSSYA